MEDRRTAVRMPLQPLADDGLVGIELAGPRRLLAWPERRFVKPLAHGARVHRQAPGDLRDVEPFGPVKVVDAAVGVIVDHEAAPGPRNSSASRRGPWSWRIDGRSAGRSSDST